MAFSYTLNSTVITAWEYSRIYAENVTIIGTFRDVISTNSYKYGTFSAFILVLLIVQFQSCNFEFLHQIPNSNPGCSKLVHM